jgi:hypothetical protein
LRVRADVPAIHVFDTPEKQYVNARDKRGHDEIAGGGDGTNQTPLD